MIIVASQRAGAKALADHLMNDRDNDHVTLSQINGFIADDLHGALDEAYAILTATQCTQFMFSVSLNPPEEAFLEEQEFHDAADRVADVMGLSNQPRAIVIHEKNGRRHAHVVWSRIDAETMTAINLPHFKLKLRDLSREMFLDHGWDLPQGLKTYGHKDPLNFTLAEWQQAQRIGVDPREMKQLFQDAWAQSDDLKSLKHALSDKGLYLAKGDRRGIVALDINGDIYALARWTGIKTKELKARLGDAPDLQPAADVGAWLQSRKTDQVKGYIAQVKDQHRKDMLPFINERAQMVMYQRQERENLKAKQDQRWVEETKARQDRLNKGLRGIFDRLIGTHSATIKRNEREALICAHRDQEQRDRLILAQITERKGLQTHARTIRDRHKVERQHLAKTIATYLKRPKPNISGPDHVSRRHNHRPRLSFDR